MAKRKTRRRRRNVFRILDALEALAYGQILSTGITGGGLWEFLTGAQDLQYGSQGAAGWETAYGADAQTGMEWKGTDIISLRDFASEPTQAIRVMTANFTANIIPMATAAFFTGLSFNVGKRVLRRPINLFNNRMMKPLLGAGIKL